MANLQFIMCLFVLLDSQSNTASGTVDPWTLSGVVISLLALIVSGMAAYYSYHANKLQREYVDIEKGREEKEHERSKQANLRADLAGDSNSARLFINNDGESEARNISILLNDKPLETCGIALTGPLPKLIGAHGAASCGLILTRGNPPPYQIELKWEDDFSLTRSYKTGLTV